MKEQVTPATLTAEEVAEVIKMHPVTILRLAREGKIPCLRIGPRTIRFSMDAVMTALEENAAKGGKNDRRR